MTDRPVQPARDWVLYWMTSARRAAYNFSLERAVEWAVDLQRPLVVLEALRSDYRWASDRLHTFVVEGMRDNARALRSRPVSYYPYLEPSPGAGKGLVQALAQHACVVVTDDSPVFFLPRMLVAAANRLDVRLEAVDANGVIPLSATSRPYPTAHAFRRFVHQYVAAHGIAMPRKNPFARQRFPVLSRLPGDITRRWPPTRQLDNAARLVARLAINHTIARAPTRGGSRAATGRLESFLDRGLSAYERDRNDPDAEATSGLSPYLHFGHIAVHEIVDRVISGNIWGPDAVELGARGSRGGWGGSSGAAAFLDQLITWRELGYNMCSHRKDFDAYESLPSWALETLAEHATDMREPTYTIEELDDATTHDALWNAAQRQLRRTGGLHNYLRMLWGKKILEWTSSPRDALRVMIELNNRYALDGRDPNSYSGIFWILGRYDRPWGPERPIFGKVRYMSSASTRRKVRVTSYLERFAA